MLCLLCKKETRDIICKRCSHDPYLIESARDILAINRHFSLLKRIYSKNYTQVKNLNSQEFWNKKFNNLERYEEQDQMTKDKINTVISFIPKNKRLLDIGLGQGYLEDRLKQKEYDVKLHAIDISDTTIKRAKERFIGEFIVCGAFDVDQHYRKKFFDVIIALELIEHISPNNIFILYKKIYSLLKRDGILIISTPLNEGLELAKNNPSGHVRQYTIPILKAELEIGKFRVKDIKTFYAFKSLYFLKRILSQTLLRNKWRPNNVVIRAVKS